jgi:DNA-nicking Smr family endonuclease
MAVDESQESCDPGENDLRLFRDAVKDVRRLAHKPRARAPVSHPPPRARLTEEDEADVMRHLLDGDVEPADMENGEELSYRQEGVQQGVLRRLKRGHYRVHAELDLHGLIVPEAKATVRTFIEDARARGVRCVRIIHGKGLRSRHRGPVLKAYLDRWLRLRDDVLAFCSARRVDGGTGAVYVLLRR